MDDFNNLKADIEAKRTAAAAPPPVPEEKRAAAPAATQSNAKVDSFAGETKVVQDTVHEKCPACGAPMTYDATAKMLFCEHCGSTKQIENAAPAAEQALDLSLDGAPKWAGETRVFRCENCGGESIFENNTFAKDCPFCGSPSVTTVEDMAGIRPNAVLPFAVSKEQAADLYALWAKKRTFAPKAFRQRQNIEDTAGLFAPAWTFDADTYSVYRGVVGDYYYVTVGSGKNQRRERRIRYRPVHGTYAQFFDDVVVHASGTLDKKRLQKIGPYPTKDATTYKPEYIAGYSAEKYQLGLAPGWAQAKNGIDATIRSRIIASLHCDVVQSLSITTDYRDKKFKYILLPLFLFKHKFKEKLYQVYLNACTRKIAGEYPKSAGKILALVFSIVGAVALAVLIGWLVTR